MFEVVDHPLQDTQPADATDSSNLDKLPTPSTIDSAAFGNSPEEEEPPARKLSKAEMRKLKKEKAAEVPSVKDAPVAVEPRDETGTSNPESETEG